MLTQSQIPTTARVLLPRVLLLGALATLALSGAAAELKIGAGPEDGEYTQTIVPAISDALAASSEHSATPVISPGSQENVDQLLAGELSVALVQLDVLALNSDAAEGTLQVLGLLAPEALLCAAQEGGTVRSYYNLTDKYSDPLVISVGEPGSGSSRTLEFLLALDPELDPDKMDLVYEPNFAAELDRLAAGSRDLVCFVRLPNPKNPLIEQVNDNDDLAFIDFVSASALEPTYGDLALYNTMSVPVSKGVLGIGANKIDTLTTWVALVARQDLDPSVTDALQQVITDPELLPPTTAAGKAKRMFGDFKDKTKDWTQSAKLKAGELTAKAKEKASELTAKAREKASDLGTKAKEKAAELGEKASDLGAKAKEKAQETATQIKEKAGELTEKVKDAVSTE